MSLFSRAKDLTMANLYKALEKAENPTVLIDQYVRNFQEQFERAQAAYASQLVQAKKFKRQVEEDETEFARLQEMAEAFAKANKVDSLKKAVSEKNTVENRLNDHKNLYEKNQLLADQLHGKVEEIEASIEKLKEERSTLIARYQTAEAEIEVNKALSEFSSDSVASGMERMRDKIAEKEALAEATNEMNNKNESLEEEYSQLSNTGKVDDEVSQLLGKYGHQ